jgi:BRCA1-associated protein
MTEETRRRREEDERFSGMLRDKQRVEQKFERFAEVTCSLKKELFEERAESNGLLKNLEAAQKRAEEGGTERAELEDQVRDIMFFLEARTKIEAGEGEMAEVAGGDITVSTPSSGPSTQMS